MVDIAELGLKVDSRSVVSATRAMGDFRGEARRTESAAQSLGSVATRAGAALAGLATIETLRRAQQLSEQFLLLEARITRLSSSSEAAAVNYQRLAEISIATGASLGDTVKLWESLNLTLRDLGGNDAQVLRLTETLQKIGTVGGSSAEDMSNALRQLGQAIAGGVVRAEEFNSILEGMPQLAREIAAGLGVPFGELRQLMLDGGLTAERVLQALQKRGADVDAEFAKIPRTVAQASESLTTNLGRAIAELDRTVGASTNLAKFIDLISKGIRLTAGDLTDLERLNELTTERAQVQQSLEMAQRRTILSAKEQAAYDQRLADINAQILEIQNRRIGQIKEENEAISGNSQKAADARAETLKGFEEERKLAAMAARERAQYKAEQALGVGATQQEIESARRLAGEIFDLTNKQNGLTEEQRLATKSAEDLARAQQSNTDVITRLAEQLYQTSLSAEQLAMRQAELQLNQYATPEQIESVRQLAGEIERVNAMQEAGKAFERVKMEMGVGVTGISELDQLNQQYAQRQEVINAALETEYLTQQQHDEAMKMLDQQTNTARMQIMQQYNQAQQAMALQSMSSIVSVTQSQVSTMQGLLDESTNIGKAFFAVSQALAAANAIVQGFQAAMAIRVAYAQMAAMSGPAAPAVLAAGEVHANVAQAMGFATAGIIAAQTVASFDGGGYTGNGSRSGGLDGKGGFMAMLHPQETVVDHTKGQGMGVTVNVMNAPPGTTANSRTGPDGQTVVDVVVGDLRSDGPISRAMGQTFGSRRVGT